MTMTMQRSPRLACAVALSLALAPVTPLHAAPAEPAPAGPDAAPVVPEPVEPPVADGPEPASVPVPPVAAAPAPRAGRTPLVLLPVALAGSDNPTIGPWVRGHLEQGLTRGDFAIVDAATVERIAPSGCDTPACLVALQGGTGASYVLRTRVTVDDRDYQVRLELLRAADGVVVVSSEQPCPLCGREELGKLVDAQAALIHRDLEGLIKGPPRLTIVSEPSGAFVFIDGQIVGQTPLDRTLVEGGHSVRVTYDGYVAEDRSIELSTGVRKSLDLKLVREPRAARLRAVGWAGVGIGVPAVAAGVALLAINGRPIRSICDAADRDQDLEGDCRWIRDTDWGGGLMLAAGAALVGIGVTLLLVHRDRDRSRGRNRAMIRPAGLGVAGRF